MQSSTRTTALKPCTAKSKFSHKNESLCGRFEECNYPRKRHVVVPIVIFPKYNIALYIWHDSFIKKSLFFPYPLYETVLFGILFVKPYPRLCIVFFASFSFAKNSYVHDSIFEVIVRSGNFILNTTNIQ